MIHRNSSNNFSKTMQFSYYFNFNESKVRCGLTPIGAKIFTVVKSHLQKVEEVPVIENLLNRMIAYNSINNKRLLSVLTCGGFDTNNPIPIIAFNFL